MSNFERTIAKQPFPHVLADRARRYLKSNFKQRLTGHAILTPAEIVATYGEAKNRIIRAACADVSPNSLRQ